MKPHIYLTWLSLLSGATFFVSESQAADSGTLPYEPIPEGYSTIYVSDYSDIKYNSDSEPIAYILQKDIDASTNSEYYISGENCLITSASEISGENKSALFSITCTGIGIREGIINGVKKIEITSSDTTSTRSNFYLWEATVSNISFISCSGITKNVYNEVGQTHVRGPVSADYANFCNNGDIEFCNNTVIAHAEDDFAAAWGGALDSTFGTLSFQNNRSVTFSGNEVSACVRQGDAVNEYWADARGGAIYTNDYFSMEGNGAVVFNNNTADAGGAVCGGDGVIKNNDTVKFSENTAGAGGALYGCFQIEGNGKVEFNKNRAFSTEEGSDTSTVTAQGGAICAYQIALNGNKLLSFSENYASSKYGICDGGAISVDNATFSKNTAISFSRNYAINEKGDVSGGALEGNNFGEVTFSENEEISFVDNWVYSGDRYAYGAAIRADTLIMTNNGSIVFSGNKATTMNRDGASSYAAAIAAYNTAFKNNESLKISENTVEGYRAYGSAIYGALDISDNGSVLFSDNAVKTEIDANGGAIYSYGSLRLQNNDSVLFTRNSDSVNGKYRLRAFYAKEAEVSLSAMEGKCIEFRDSVLVSTDSSMSLNADYTDAEGNPIKQQGDIIFTGATTEDDLYEVKGDVAGTAEEIRLSRTSEVYTMTNLYGGRLRVEDGAIYLGQGITVHEGSEATVRVKDAELSHVGYNLTFNDGTALEVAGESTIRGLVNLQEGSVFKLEQGATLNLYETNGVALSVGGLAWLEGASTLNADLTLAEGSTLDIVSLDAGAVALNGVLTFGGQVILGENLLALLDEKLGHESSITLFTGLENVDWATVTGNAVSDCVWAGAVFSNMAGNHSYYLNYASDTGSLVMQIVPEPATATLSLLALAALAARRRRN